jgi:hypothetical protein
MYPRAKTNRGVVMEGRSGEEGLKRRKVDLGCRQLVKLE